MSPKLEGSRSLLTERSLLVLLILTRYCKSVLKEEAISEKSDDFATSDLHSKGNTYLCDNPYYKALENAGDIECKASSFEVFCYNDAFHSSQV